MIEKEQMVKRLARQKDKTFMLRPAFYGWGIYEPLETNRAKLLMVNGNRSVLADILKEAGVNYV